MLKSSVGRAPLPPTLPPKNICLPRLVQSRRIKVHGTKAWRQPQLLLLLLLTCLTSRHADDGPANLMPAPRRPLIRTDGSRSKRARPFRRHQRTPRRRSPNRGKPRTPNPFRRTSRPIVSRLLEVFFSAFRETIPATSHL